MQPQFDMKGAKAFWFSQTLHGSFNAFRDSFHILVCTSWCTIALSRERRGNEADATLDLGTFEMVSDRMVVSDPCYDADLWCRGELENVLPGIWQAYAVKRDKGEWGSRVVRLVAVHREYADKCETAAELATFEVGVDSGQAGLFDCLHYRDDTVAVEHPNVSRKDAGKLWYMQCCCQTLTREAAGVLPYGVVASSGYGDGFYDCFVGRNCDGKIVRVEIEFIPGVSKLW